MVVYKTLRDNLILKGLAMEFKPAPEKEHRTERPA